MIKLNKRSVKDQNTGKKARVHFSLDSHLLDKKCVWIFAEDTNSQLSQIFTENREPGQAISEDDMLSDRVILFENHPLYKQARDHVENLAAPYNY